MGSVCMSSRPLLIFLLILDQYVLSDCISFNILSVRI